MLSPRECEGFYLAAQDFSTEDVKVHMRKIEDKDKIKIIYPFYQYGAYSCYKPEKTQYYLPGSSVKGAIKSRDNSGASRFMVDDLHVDAGKIHLYNLWKAQYISPNDENKQQKQMKMECFFPNVAVEMLDADQECIGEFLCDQDPRENLLIAQESTKTKLKQLVDRIDQILKIKPDSDQQNNCAEVLDKVQQNISNINYSENEFILLLGGYKGLLLSGVFSDESIESAIYVDMEKQLPHGLVKIKLE